MASKLTMSMYNDKQKKNTFQPYIDAGNAAKAASTPQSMSLSVNKYSSYQTGNNALKNAYSANKNNAISMQSQSAANNQPSATNGQTALQKAYQTNSNSGSGYYSSERQNALNQAETSYNKLLNYLPEYQELMGMRGLGISNQALMNAYGKYQQSVSDINSQYDALEKEYALQQDALAKEELETQMARATYARDDLQAYITSAGDNFTQEGYNRFKQGLLEAGYTQQEIDAAEKMLSQSDWAVINNAVENNNTNNILSEDLKQVYAITGDGILASTATEQMFGDYYDTGKKGTKQYNLVQDILKAGREGRIPNGTYFDFNYGAGPADDPLYVYYNGYFYPTSFNAMRHPGIDDTAIVGRGTWLDTKNKYIDPNDL